MAKTSTPHTENPFDELGEQVSTEADQFFEIVQPLIEEMGRVNDTQILDLSKKLAKAGQSFTVDALRIRLEALVEAGLLEKQSMFGMSEYRVKT
jgi:hypothetical protein